LKAAIELATKELADVLSPDPEDEAHLNGLSSRYRNDMREAKEDAECYEDKISANFQAAEWYERAQLCAEIGIVVASVALLLSSRIIWIVSLVFGIGCAGIIGRTYVYAENALRAADHKIVEAQKRSAYIEGEEVQSPEGAESPKKEP
jgi:hypothetical protein